MKFEQLNFKPEILFLNNGLIFFDKKGSVLLKFDNNGKILWKKIIIINLKKNLIQFLSFSKNDNNLIITDNLSKFYLINLNSGEFNLVKK